MYVTFQINKNRSSQGGRSSFYCVLLSFMLPVLTIDDQTKMLTELDEQFVTQIRDWCRVTERSPLSVTWTHPQAHGKCLQTAHARYTNKVVFSFVWKMQSFF